MHGGVDRADRLAGRRFALLTGDRLGDHFDRVVVDLAATGLFAISTLVELGYRFRIELGRREVTIHADPVHLATSSHLVLADDRDVVLRLAGDRAGIAADARMQIDGHRPLVMRIDAERVMQRKARFGIGLLL